MLVVTTLVSPQCATTASREAALWAPLTSLQVGIDNSGSGGSFGPTATMSLLPVLKKVYPSPEPETARGTAVALWGCSQGLSCFERCFFGRHFCKLFRRVWNLPF